MKKVSFILLISLLLSPLISFGQSKAIDNFTENADGTNLFIYQSVLRVFNQDKNEDFNMLIRDLDHLKILMTDSIGLQSNVIYSKLEKELGIEGYEELMSFENQDFEGIVFSKELKNGKENWVVIYNLGIKSGLIEMRGSVDTKYLGAVASLNLDLVKTILPLANNDILEIRDDFEEDE